MSRPRSRAPGSRTRRLSSNKPFFYIVGAMERRLLGGLLVLAAALAVGLGSRRMAKPRAERAEPFRIKGAEGARISIVEFSDFQCPACKYAEGPLRKILSIYGQDIR